LEFAQLGQVFGQPTFEQGSIATQAGETVALAGIMGEGDSNAAIDVLVDPIPIEEVGFEFEAPTEASTLIDDVVHVEALRGTSGLKIGMDPL
jgi:hypothetical protein